MPLFTGATWPQDHNIVSTNVEMTVLTADSGSQQVSIVTRGMVASLGGYFPVFLQDALRRSRADAGAVAYQNRTMALFYVRGGLETFLHQPSSTHAVMLGPGGQIGCNQTFPRESITVHAGLVC